MNQVTGQGTIIHPLSEVEKPMTMISSDEVELYKEDFKSLISSMKKDESLLRLKRRWLMDLPLSKTDQKRIQEILPGGDKILPESFVREGDPIYEEVRACVEREHGRLRSGKKSHGTNPAAARSDYHAATHALVDVLEEFPLKAIRPMYRKLNGDTDFYTPSFEQKRDGVLRWKLTSQVKELLLKALADFDESGGPAQQRLADVLAVASLQLRLMKRPALQDFRKTSPETESLQNEILEAISQLNNPKRISVSELKKVQLLLSPDSQKSVRSLRMAVRNLLIDYLFECNDRNNVPDCLLETLRVINRRLQRPPSLKKRSSSRARNPPPQVLNKDNVQKEIECVLTLSAQAKDVLSNMAPELEIDEKCIILDEEFERSDGFCIAYDYGDEFRDGPDQDQAESIGETNQTAANGSIPYMMPTENNVNQVFGKSQGVVVDVYQKACDNASMAAYEFARYMLSTFQSSENSKGSSGSSSLINVQEIWRNMINKR